jgi:hypothetical protein
VIVQLVIIASVRYLKRKVLDIGVSLQKPGVLTQNTLNQGFIDFYVLAIPMRAIPGTIAIHTRRLILDHDRVNHFRRGRAVDLETIFQHINRRNGDDQVEA